MEPDGDAVGAITARRSVRTFEDRPLLSRQLEVLQRCVTYINSIAPTHLSASVRTSDPSNRNFRPSTYGVIKNAAAYMIMAFDMQDTEMAIAAGAAMQRCVITATEHGIGTCWISGTFKAASFAEGVVIPLGAKINVVVACGIIADRPRLFERIERAIVRASSRKPMAELVKSQDEETLNKVKTALELMRLSPSSVNSQPWRVGVSNGRVDFFFKRKQDVNAVDIGIALADFDLAAKQTGIAGKWIYQQPAAMAGQLEYAASFLVD